MTSFVVRDKLMIQSAKWTPRQKRRQVARACDACRTQRVKCHDSVPCSNCAAKGITCSNSSNTKTVSLQEARSEVERLQARVKQLEAQLVISDRTELQSPPAIRPSTVTATTEILVGTHSEHHGQPSDSIWGGVLLRPPRSPHACWFGPASLHHFTTRLSTFLNSSLESFNTTDSTLPQSENSRNPTDGPLVDLRDTITKSNEYPDLDTSGVFLTPTQEEYFMDLFWQTYHTSLYVVLNESGFKKHYQSLWMSNLCSRRNSALVDIVIAMCMQYGVSSLSSDRQGSIIWGEDATMAGRWHYRRGWTLLAYEMESPTISTLQGYLLCAVYLCGGSFHNMVDSTCGLAVRIAYQLGLHVEPSRRVSEEERQLRRRLWWAVCLLDSKMAIKFGRPFMVSVSATAPALPEDSLEVAKVSGSAFAPIGPNTTWLSFSLHQIKLYNLVREALTAIYGTNISLPQGHTVWDHPWALEQIARGLTSYMKRLEDWTRQLPESLKTRRRGGANAYATNRSILEIEQFAPAWLQRQRIVLEGGYHHLCICLLRPFITFGAELTEGSLAESNAQRCIEHAIELSRFLQQVITATSILNGWHEAFQWQWSATITLVGFVSAYPTNRLATEAREALSTSISVLEIFGTSFAASASASSLVKDLYSRINALTPPHSLLGPALAGSGPTLDPIPADKLSDLSCTTKCDEGVDSPGFVSNEGFNSLGDFDIREVAATVDFWEDMDMLWPGLST